VVTLLRVVGYQVGSGNSLSSWVLARESLLEGLDITLSTDWALRIYIQ